MFQDIEENLRAMLAVFARAEPSGESCLLPGVAVASSGVQFSMFNSAVLTSPVSSVAELDARIEIAGRFFAERRLGWSFWVCRDWIDPGMRAKTSIVFDRRRMHLVVELPAMCSASLAPPARPLPPLRISPVADAVTRADFSYIMTTAFGIPIPVSRAIYESECTWTSGFTGYVGYIDDMVISSTATLVTGKVAGVYAVGTAPAWQHRGYAEAVMRYALDHVRAETGIEAYVLQSSESGYRLYERMGYRAVTRYAVFAVN